MKTYTVYVCECCGFECKNRDKLLTHEASHLNLTKEEYNNYNSMKNLCHYIISNILTSGKDKDALNLAKKKYNELAVRIYDFENEHHIAHSFYSKRKDGIN